MKTQSSSLPVNAAQRAKRVADPERIRGIERASKRRRAAVFKAMGLNSRGREYQRAPNRSPEERRRANLWKWRGLCRRRLLLGQTSRGGRRVYLVTLPAADVLALEAEIDLLGEALAVLFDSLNGKAQARAVLLANRLALLKSRIQVVNERCCFKNS